MEHQALLLQAWRALVAAESMLGEYSSGTKMEDVGEDYFDSVYSQVGEAYLAIGKALKESKE